MNKKLLWILILAPSLLVAQEAAVNKLSFFGFGGSAACGFFSAYNFGKSLKAVQYINKINEAIHAEQFYHHLYEVQLRAARLELMRHSYRFKWSGLASLGVLAGTAVMRKAMTSYAYESNEV